MTLLLLRGLLLLGPLFLRGSFLSRLLLRFFLRHFHLSLSETVRTRRATRQAGVTISTAGAQQSAEAPAT